MACPLRPDARGELLHLALKSLESGGLSWGWVGQGSVTARLPRKKAGLSSGPEEINLEL